LYSCSLRSDCFDVRVTSIHACSFTIFTYIYGLHRIRAAGDLYHSPYLRAGNSGPSGLCGHFSIMVRISTRGKRAYTSSINVRGLFLAVSRTVRCMQTNCSLHLAYGNRLFDSWSVLQSALGRTRLPIRNTRIAVCHSFSLKSWTLFPHAAPWDLFLICDGPYFRANPSDLFMLHWRVGLIDMRPVLRTLISPYTPGPFISLIAVYIFVYGFIRPPFRRPISVQT